MRSLLNEFQSRERHACGLMKVPRTRYRYRSCHEDKWLLELAREKPQFGYRRRLGLGIARSNAANYA